MDQNEEEDDYEYVLTPDKVPNWTESLKTIKMYEKFPKLKLINRLPQFLPLLEGESRMPRFLPNAEFNEKVCLWRGDLLRLNIDAIVNSAHHHMGGGGGIDGKIQWKAGPELIGLIKNKICPVGQSIVTPGFEIPCKYIIHTVTSKDPNLNTLETCYRSVLEKVEEHNFRTVGICCIGTGHYEHPPVAAARVALSAIREWLEINNNSYKVDKIIFSVFSARDECIYEELMPCYFPPP